MSLRISVSDLDQVRWYRDHEDMTLEALLSRLRREEPPTPAMAMGTAFHTLLERASAGETLDDCEQDGFRFRFDLDAEIALPPVRECKGEREMMIDGVPVTLVGKVDGLDGMRVWDHKLSSRFDAETYANAMQWRAYLWMFQGWQFTYNVFTRFEDRDGTIIVREFHPMDFYAYPGMEDEVLAEVREFVNLCKAHLPEKLAA